MDVSSMHRSSVAPPSKGRSVDVLTVAYTYVVLQLSHRLGVLHAFLRLTFQVAQNAARKSQTTSTDLQRHEEI